MAEHKIPQNVEAEDKLIGPLSFRQFIYAIVAAILVAGAVFGFKVSPIVSVLFAPPALLFIILAFYRRPDQSVESYLVALFGYQFKPRKRKWDNDGIAEHVQITAPKKAENRLSDGRTRTQVKDQLGALAEVIDTRGWSSRGVDSTKAEAEDDRLVSLEEISFKNTQNQTVPEGDVAVAEDVMESSEAQDLATRSQQATQQAREQAIQNMRQAAENSK